MEGRNSSCLAESPVFVDVLKESLVRCHAPPFPWARGPGMVPQMERWNLILLAFNQNRIMCLISLPCKWKGEIHEFVGGEGFQAGIWYSPVYINMEITVEKRDKSRLRSSPTLPCHYFKFKLFLQRYCPHLENTWNNTKIVSYPDLKPRRRVVCPQCQERR